MDENNKNLEPNEEKNAVRRKLVKRFAIIFFAGLLLLTFFSNTIMNKTLPEVETVVVSSGTVAKKVRCQGTVEVCQDVELTVSGSRKVKEVLVENGDTVKEGDVIMTFEETENTELAEAEKQLETLENNYEKSLLKLGPDYEDENEAINEAEEQLQDAKDDQVDASKKNVKLNTLKAKLKKAQTKVNAQQDKVDKLKAKADKYTEKGDYDTAAQAVETDKTAVKDDQSTLATLKKELARLTEDYNDAKNNYNANIGAYNEYKTKLAEYQQQQSEYEAGLITVEPIPPEEVAEPELPNEKEYNRNVEDKQAAITAAEQKLAEDQAQLTKDQKTLSDLAPSVKINKDLKEAQSLLEKYNNEVTKIEKEIGDYGEVLSDEDAADNVKTKQKALDTAVDSLDDKKAQDALDAQTAAYDNAAAVKEIEEQKKKVEKLRKIDDAKEIRATESGVISGITAKAGDEVTAESPLASIQMENSGYEVSCTINKEEAKRLAVGDEAQIENIWDDGVTSEVKSIKADPSNPNQQNIVKFKVEGDINPGEELQFAVGDKAQRYDTVVPNNAVKEDSDGKFVLITKVKATPLGNRYIVDKCRVEVSAQDTTNSAISGEIVEYDNVVTNASRSIDDGQQVRLSEN